jgi:hypothetical protein
MLNSTTPRRLLTLLLLASLMVFAGYNQVEAEDETVYLANGIKIGEVSDTTAIIWSRVTQVASPINQGSHFVITNRKLSYQFGSLSDQELGPDGGYGHQLPEGVSLDQMAHAVPGCSGEVRLTFLETGKQGTKKTIGWQPVDPNRDFTKQFPLRA